METYSDLKFENEELLNKMKEIDPGMFCSEVESNLNET